jgi:hypothetical protein
MELKRMLAVFSLFLVIVLANPMFAQSVASSTGLSLIFPTGLPGTRS